MIQLELESLEGLGWATSLYLQCFYHDQAHKNFKFKDPGPGPGPAGHGDGQWCDWARRESLTP